MGVRNRCAKIYVQVRATYDYILSVTMRYPINLPSAIDHLFLHSSFRVHENAMSRVAVSHVYLPFPVFPRQS